jgi:DNA (cytosine-5)-methyltransferase 1
MNTDDFRNWLKANTAYTNRVISNIISRVRRANNILTIYNKTVYLFELEQTEAFKNMSCSVKSQIRKSVKLYQDFLSSVVDDKGGYE